VIRHYGWKIEVYEKRNALQDRFFKNLPEDITFSRSHFEEISIALRTPHECPEPNCDAKDFKKDTDYTCHMKEAHGVEKSFKCPQCKHRF